jgi:hypothetical protein
MFSETSEHIQHTTYSNPGSRNYTSTGKKVGFRKAADVLSCLISRTALEDLVPSSALLLSSQAINMGTVFNGIVENYMNLIWKRSLHQFFF